MQVGRFRLLGLLSAIHYQGTVVTSKKDPQSTDNGKRSNHFIFSVGQSLFLNIHAHP